MTPSDLNALSRSVLDSAFEVHTQLGPGLLESTYAACLLAELAARGIETKAQHPLPVIYRNLKPEAGYRIDILVENNLILELKSVDAIIPVHRAQLLTYLKLSGLRLGLLLNFNTVHLKEGVVRLVNGL